jgi:hypothetical protein
MKRCMTVSLLLSVYAFVGQVSAQYPTPSTVPFTNSYEDPLLSGTSILFNASAGSWTSTVAEAAAYVTNMVYDKPGVGYPLPDEKHSNVVVFAADNGTIANAFTGVPQNYVWIDTMILPVSCDELPQAVTNSHMGVCFLANGTKVSPCIYHGAFTNLAEVKNVQAETNRWSVFSSVQVQTGKWVRLTIEVHYNDRDEAQPVFSARINGVPLSNGLGFATPEMDVQTGSWFRCSTATTLELGSIVLAGSGMIDDLLVSQAQPVFLDTVASNGIPYEWLDANGLGTNDYPLESYDTLASGDWDADGRTTFEEWISGTEPNNSNSLLKIISQTISGSNVSIQWLSSTSTLNGAYYTFDLSTNLLGIWHGFTNIPATVPGTNILSAPAPSLSPAFLRVAVTNTYAP